MPKKILVFLITLLVLYHFDRPEKVRTSNPQPPTHPVVLPVKPQPKPKQPKEKPWDERVEWIHHDVVKERMKGNTIYADIINHTPSYQKFSGLMTDAHENLHGIHNHFMNKYSDGGRNKHYGLYGENGRVAIIKEPNTRIRDAHAFIPDKLRGYRFKLYLVSQAGSWGDRPLYIFDEWVAYYLGGAAGVEAVRNGTYNGGWTDGVSGALEFVIYSTGIAMSVDDKDPEYFKNNTQFKAFLAYGIKRSMEIFYEGRVMDDFKWDKQETLYESFINSPEGEEMRGFLRRTFGKEWVKKNIGFE